MEAEPILFIGADRASATAQLLHAPSEAPVLKDARGTVTYELQKDYLWTAGSRDISLTATSRIPFKTIAELHPAPHAPNAYASSRDGKSWMLYGAGSFWHDMQCHAFYPAMKDDWQAPQVSPAPEAQLGALRERLKSKTPLKIIMLGDSISTGADASGVAKVAPMQPGYPELVASGIQSRSGCPVTLTNLSVGGMDSTWGITRVPDVIAAQPDIFMIAFGMNDASGHRTPEDLAANTRKMIEPVRAAFPQCTIILVGSMTANSEWVHSSPDLYPKYVTALEGLVGPGIACANVTKVWTEIAVRKKYLDLSGNGLNHPNDFGHRIYADVILSVLGIP